MKGEFSSDDLKQLFALLSEKHPDGGAKPPPRRVFTEAEQRLLENDSIERSDFQDLVSATDRRAWGQAGHYAPALAAYFRISEASLCRKPQHVDDQVLLFQGFCAVDAVALLIYMESLGFRVFPERLVAKLKKRLINKPVMTESEYRIWTYEQSRKRQKQVIKSSAIVRPGFPETKSHKDQAGNRVTLTLQGEEALYLEVRGARYREIRNDFKVCEYCGFGYLASSRSDRVAIVVSTGPLSGYLIRPPTDCSPANSRPGSQARKSAPSNRSGCIGRYSGAQPVFGRTSVTTSFSGRGMELRRPLSTGVVTSSRRGRTAPLLVPVPSVGELRPISTAANGHWLGSGWRLPTAGRALCALDGPDSWSCTVIFGLNARCLPRWKRSSGCMAASYRSAG